MALKHVLATAVATAAITAALVAVGAGTANATPLPVPPGPVNLPIYTQPGTPGFHLPPSIIVLKPGPVLKPAVPVQFRPFHVAPTSCDQLFPGGSPQAGSTLSADHTVRATTDANVVALLNAQPTLLNCTWSNSKTGLQLEVSVALINSSLVSPVAGYLSAQGFAGYGNGAGISSWAIGTPISEKHDLSTNGFWVVTRGNDGHVEAYDETVIESVWGLNGVSAADFE